MNKKQLHHQLTRLRQIRLRYLVVVFVISTMVAALALRHNNAHMVELKQAVFAADQKGGDVEKALQNLQVYVTAHMNTQLSTGSDAVYPPVQLKYTYERLVKAESNKLAQSNSELYNSAQSYCEKLNSNDFSGRNRIPCIQQYVKDHGGSSLANIPDSLYKFDFVSPAWSPDLAGWSVVAAVLSFMILAVVAGLRFWLQRVTK
jgi:preprotein translocase subunit SecF